MKYLFLLIIIMMMSAALFANGAVAKPCRTETGGYCVNVAAVAGVEFLGTGAEEPGGILVKLFQFGMGLIGLSALIMIVFGGIVYMTAGDSQERIKKAKGYINNAIFGLILALLSFLILYTINPDLVKELGNITQMLERAQQSVGVTSGGTTPSGGENYGSSDAFYLFGGYEESQPGGYAQPMGFNESGASRINIPDVKQDFTNTVKEPEVPPELKYNY